MNYKEIHNRIPRKLHEDFLKLNKLTGIKRSFNEYVISALYKTLQEDLKNLSTEKQK